MALPLSEIEQSVAIFAQISVNIFIKA